MQVVPALDGLSGPTQSIVKYSKELLTTGMGYNGAGANISLGFPTIWHVWQVLIKLATSLYNRGQKKLRITLV